MVRIECHLGVLEMEVLHSSIQYEDIIEAYKCQLSCVRTDGQQVVT